MFIENLCRSVNDQRVQKYNRSDYLHENIDLVLENVVEDPNISISRPSRVEL